jgi:hypothetical protein
MNTLDRTLELFAAGEPDPAMVEAAQRKLDAFIVARSSLTRRPARRLRGWLAAATTAAVAVVAILWLPLTPSPALAFERVQQHLREFRTLRFDMEQRMNGELVMKTRVNVTHDGNVRTDAGDDVSVIVNSSEKRVLTLVHSARIAVVSPLGAPATHEDALDWLDDIRDFQGQARLLPGTRVIGGHEARGWELPMVGGNIVLWATDEGLPLEMTMGEKAPLQIGFHFEFDLPLAPGLFSTQVPAGYSLADQED